MSLILNAFLNFRCRALAAAICIIIIADCRTPNAALADTFTVTVASWSSNPTSCINGDPCSLYDAIQLSNATPGLDTIEFNIVGTGSGVQTITPDPQSLVNIAGPVIIDGTSQDPNATTPVIEIRGDVNSVSTITVAASNCTIKGLIFSGFSDSGLTIDNVSDTTIIGNWFGLTSTGKGTRGNGNYGIKVVNSPRTTISRNIISGNSDSGIKIQSSGSVTIDGNIIGLDDSAKNARGNSSFGIKADNSANLTIGGTNLGSRNVISGNGASGIKLANGSFAIIAGNWIGLDITGAAAVGNGNSGIEILNYSNATIGGTSSNARNVISGNQQHGISITNSTLTTIDGNWIGVDATGTSAVANGLSGITVNGSNGTVIGGSTPGPHNIISGNGASGIKLANGNTSTVTGNWIGLDADGSKAVPNATNGIEISSYATATIGGSTSGTRNVISGNGSDGISILGLSSSGNQIKGNYIGTDSAGSTAIPNAGGIFISSPNNFIGGTVTGEGNVISGYNATAPYQIKISNTEGNQVYGNYIGTNAAGTASLTSDSQGVPGGVGIAIYDSRNNTIGTPGAGNLISGNNIGIELKATTLNNTGNIIQSNRIGTNLTESAAIPNVNGIVITANNQGTLSDNTIGGENASSSMKGNVISGNGLGTTSGRGIQMVGSFIQSNTIQGNFIGTSADSSKDLGNTGPGILLDCSNTDISDNTIYYNGDAGITMLSGTGNQLSLNRIFANAGLGIDQYDQQATSGPNPADAGDGDSGPNNLQNFPEFTVMVPSRGQIQTQGTLDSTPSTTFSLEFYLNSTIDESGYGEGETFLGSKTVTTDASGQVAFSETFSGTVSTNGGVTAIATDSNGNTSEFSLGIRLPLEVKPGGKVDLAPIVAVVDDVVTVSLPLYQPQRKKKGGKSLGLHTRAAKKTVNYQITVKKDARSVVQRITSKRNVVTIRNLPPGNYAVNYRVNVKEGKTVVATTRPSPSTNFSIRQSASSFSLNALYRALWCPEFMMKACEEYWP